MKNNIGAYIQAHRIKQKAAKMIQQKPKKN